MRMTAEDRRRAVRDAYRQLLGRNRYSQELRDWCFIPWRDGHYYSDCSSSICYSYARAGCSFGVLNTVGMITSPRLRRVDVAIREGVPADLSRLRVGDLLLFAGNDESRAGWEYVGHVEMVGELGPEGAVLYGHGSGTPSKKDLIACCRRRQGMKAATRRGNRGLIRVLRLIPDDDPREEGRVLRVQKALLALGYPLPCCGADGEYGPETAAAIRAFRRDRGLPDSGEVDEALMLALGLFGRVRVTGGSVYVRAEPEVREGNPLGVAHAGDLLRRTGAPEGGFHPVEFRGGAGWISEKWTRIEGGE